LVFEEDNIDAFCISKNFIQVGIMCFLRSQDVFSLRRTNFLSLDFNVLPTP